MVKELPKWAQDEIKMQSLENPNHKSEQVTFLRYMIKT